MIDLRSAAAGLLSVLPVLFLNAIAGNAMDPMAAALRISTNEIFANPGGLFAILVGIGFAAAGCAENVLAVLRRRTPLWPVNAVVAVLAGGVALLFVAVLAVDYTQCEILRIPNCD